MLKKPLPRKKIVLDTTPRMNMTHGVVYDIIHPRVTPTLEQEKRFYYQNSDQYLRILEENYKQLGVPFKKPQVSDPPNKTTRSSDVEKHFDFPDRLVVKINILKSGIVRVKILTSMVNLWEKYYSKSKTPPPKSVISAYKNMGYSETFIKNLQSNFDKKKAMKVRYEKIIESIFEKAPKKKVSTAPKKEVKPRVDPDEDFDEPPEDDENVDDDDVQPEEDEGIADDVEDDVEEDANEDIEADDVD